MPVYEYACRACDAVEEHLQPLGSDAPGPCQACGGELLEEANVNPEYVELLADASLTVKTASETIRAVERSLAQPGDRSETRRAIATELFHSAGNATSLAVNELYELLNLEPPDLRVQ